jgi:predicted DNA-binding transcriptional regulator YafY
VLVAEMNRQRGTTVRVMHLSGLEEVERWVLSWGTHVTVIHPELLAERVGSMARALTGQYETF